MILQKMQFALAAEEDILVRSGRVKISLGDEVAVRSWEVE